jgi:hypothetical protein
MPYASDLQRRWMHWAHPAMARRWDAEEKGAPPIGPAKSFPDLLARGVTGISDRVLRDHVTLYERACAELAALEQNRPRTVWRAPADLALPPGEVQRILEAPVSAAAPAQPEGPLLEAIVQVGNELTARGISWRPTYVVGEADFWTADQATSINVPWTLSSMQLWKLVNDQAEKYSYDDVVRILRHEVGHALGYAFELWRGPVWRAAFGDFFAPYRDEFPIDVTATADFVDHLASMPSSPNAHYAQKHPDEDWAETFAVWLDPGSRWRETYADRPGALVKLEAVDRMLVGEGAAYGTPSNTRTGRTEPASGITYTVGEYLGRTRPPGSSGALLRGQGPVYDAVVLHEAYFGGLTRGPTPPGARFLDACGPAYGGFDGWAADMRAIAAATDGWALAVWEPRDGRVRNFLVEGHDRGVPAGCPVLVALDLHDHAYAGDYGIQKHAYVGAWFRGVNWYAVEARLNEANPPPVTVQLIPPTITLVGEEQIVSSQVVIPPTEPRA